MIKEKKIVQLWYEYSIKYILQVCFTLDDSKIVILFMSEVVFSKMYR